MSNFVEIKEENLCPVCGKRLFYRIIEARSEAELMMDSSNAKYAWYCSRCDKYFEKRE